MAIEKGNNVKVEYEGKLEDGTIFDTSSHGDHEHLLEFTVGEGKVIKGFDDAIIGMEVGEEKEITLTPEQAYGQPDPNNVQKIPKSAMAPGQEEPKPGMTLMLANPEGQQFPAVIKEVEADTITLDLNHPLAGKTLIFKVKVREVA